MQHPSNDNIEKHEKQPHLYGAQKRRKGMTREKKSDIFSKNLETFSQGINKEKINEGARNKIRRHPDKIKANVQINELLSDC